MKQYGLLLALVSIIVSVGLSGCADNDNNDNPVAVIDTTKGTIKVELFEDKLPKTTENFVKLVDDGFYDGLIFHRIKDNFMIQGGLQYPDGTTKSSPYGPIDLETHPDVQHVDGAISMARTAAPNSATSQFFICDGAQHLLDGQYAAFGVVVDGIDVVRAIASAPHDGSLEPSPGGGKPLQDIIINSIVIGSDRNEFIPTTIFFEEFLRNIIRCDQSCLCASLNCHVAQCHPARHSHIFYSVTAEFQSFIGRPISADQSYHI